ncbi:MAG TPA: ribosome assembly cofactor RimP [Phnomibacter sp.]|nr:ribosome assembly cofactor RimP [Phnomibacter sp.]
MEKEKQIAIISQQVEALLAAQPGYFLVQVRIKPTNNVKVFIDADGGVSIDDCIKVNRSLYAWLETSGLFPPEDFSLEVSSPGVGEPLVLYRQYVKNIGRQLQVKLHEGSPLEGELKAATEDGIVLEVTTGKGKKAQTQAHSLLFEQIKEASVQVKF